MDRDEERSAAMGVWV